MVPSAFYGCFLQNNVELSNVVVNPWSAFWSADPDGPVTIELTAPKAGELCSDGRSIKGCLKVQNEGGAYALQHLSPGQNCTPPKNYLSYTPVLDPSGETYRFVTQAPNSTGNDSHVGVYVLPEGSQWGCLQLVYNKEEGDPESMTEGPFHLPYFPVGKKSCMHKAYGGAVGGAVVGAAIGYTLAVFFFFRCCPSDFSCEKS